MKPTEIKVIPLEKSASALDFETYYEEFLQRIFISLGIPEEYIDPGLIPLCYLKEKE